MPAIRRVKPSFQIYNEDCFETFKRIEDGSVALILVDLPYGITQNKWDSLIELPRMWVCVRRVLGRHKPAVFTSGQPFTSILILSNLESYKYCWVWDKVNRPTGHLNAKKQPLRQTEDIVVFCKESCPTYYPQMEDGKPYKATGSKTSSNYGSQVKTTTVCEDGKRYPRNLLKITADERGTVGRLHPTQKPVALMEYLIRTYSQVGDLVVDFAMGSGTTGVACGNLGRSFIGCDTDVEHGYFQIAKERIEIAYASDKGQEE